MSMASMVRTIKKAEPLLVTPHVVDFLDRVPDGVVWDEEALEFWADLVRKAMGNEDRSGRFGASSRGMCMRRQIFAFIGMPVLTLRPVELSNLFNDGKWRHLRWQMMAVQAGALTHAEVPYSKPSLRISGSMDGCNAYDSWGFELKGDRNMSRVLEGGVPEAHLLQIHTMMLATGWDTFSYIIEDKANNDWREFIIRRDKTIINTVKTEIEELNIHVNNETLPQVLPACAAKSGPFRGCPFSKQCLAQKDQWPDDKQWAA